MRHPLARALQGIGLDMTDVASRLEVDPKTVARWIDGRVPYPRHRAALAQMTGWTERDLWPAAAPSEPTNAASEVLVTIRTDHQSPPTSGIGSSTARRQK